MLLRYDFLGRQVGWALASKTDATDEKTKDERAVKAKEEVKRREKRKEGRKEERKKERKQEEWIRGENVDWIWFLGNEAWDSLKRRMGWDRTGQDRMGWMKWKASCRGVETSQK